MPDPIGIGSSEPCTGGRHHLPGRNPQAVARCKYEGPLLSLRTFFAAVSAMNYMKPFGLYGSDPRLLIGVVTLLFVPGLPAKEDQAHFGRFGTVHLYSQSERPSRVALFVSGDGGWNMGVVDMARELASLDALVVGIDMRTYMKALAAATESCLYPASDFEALSKFVQKKLDYPSYMAPVLVGYSSGATLVYATLVQAPSNTFLGAISMGFCPDLPLTKPMCRGSGLAWQPGPKGKGYSFLPANTLEVPWVALQGAVDQVCDPGTTQDYVRKVPQGELLFLPKVGHGFSVPRNWMPQFRDAFIRMTASAQKPVAQAPAEAVGDLPLIEVPAPGSQSDTLAVIVTGDGGWGVTDRGIATSLAAHGIPTIGLNSLRYFWAAKTPDQAARDLSRILLHYLETLKKERAVLIGYSMGADVLPFMINRLPADLHSRIKLAVLIGLGSKVEFEFHLRDWFGPLARSGSLPVRPEVEKLKGLRILCFYGRDDNDALCRQLDPALATSLELEGGHRVGRGFERIVESILMELK